MGDYQKEFFSHIFDGPPALVLDHILLNSPKRGITEYELTTHTGVPIYVLPAILKRMLNWEIIRPMPGHYAPNEETRYVVATDTPMGRLFAEIDKIHTDTPKMSGG